MHNIVFLAYGFLYLTVIALWFPQNLKVRFLIFFLVLALLLAYLDQVITLIAILPIVLLALALFFSSKKKNNLTLKIASGILALALSIGLAIHAFPGFNNYKVLHGVYISQDAIPFSLYLNFDKALVGIFILALTHHLISKKKDWLALIKKTWLPLVLLILIVMILALILNFVRFEPKLPKSLPIWAITDLLFVCVAEEALFRGFIQKNLALLFNKARYADYWAILIAAIVFGLTHYPGGVKYILLASVAGFGYGWIYVRTQYIESAILTHFSLNLTHFLFFTYPMLVAA